MSTRCQIGFYGSEKDKLEDWEVMIYRHCDGYPESEGGVMATVVPILEDFDKNQGLSDIEYASAWLVAKLKDSYSNIGICGKHGLHGDIDYYYAVSPESVRVFKTPLDSDFKGMKEMKKHKHTFQKVKAFENG